jgi:hypothetical protein
VNRDFAMNHILVEEANGWIDDMAKNTQKRRRTRSIGGSGFVAGQSTHVNLPVPYPLVTFLFSQKEQAID